MTKLDRTCLAILVVVTTLCGYWTVSYGNKQKRQIQQERELLSKRLKDLNLADTNLQRLRAVLDATRLELKTLNERIPEKTNMGEFLKKVDSLTKERQLVLIQLEPQPTVEHKLYTKISVRLLFKGSFVNTHRLIYDLETMNRKLIIEKIRISKSDNDQDCRVDLTAAVFTRRN
jgi:Tfp pilus assembly protein PilO